MMSQLPAGTFVKRLVKQLLRVVSLMALNVVFGAICLNLRRNKSFVDIACEELNHEKRQHIFCYSNCLFSIPDSVDGYRLVNLHLQFTRSISSV